MEAPLGIPVQWIEIVKGSKDASDLYVRSFLRKDRFPLFSAAIDDSTWVERHGTPFVKKMLEDWSTIETAPKETASEIRKNISHLEPLLPETLAIFVGEKVEHVFPLLFQDGGGEWFKDLYNHYTVNENSPLLFSGIPEAYFPFLKEYFYSGKVERLWKEEPETVEALHALAERYGLKDLSTLVFRTFKNYLREESLIGLLKKAIKERSYLLAEELCTLLNNRLKGVKIKLQGNGLQVVLERIPEEAISLNELTTSLVVKDVEYLPKDFLEGDRLVSLKLSGQNLPSYLKENGPHHLEVLDLSECVWAWELVEAWSKDLKGLKSLKVAKTPPIPYTTWPFLENLRGLKELDLSYQPAFSPTAEDLLHATFPNLENLIIKTF